MILQKHMPELSFLPTMFAPRYTHRLYKSYEYTDQVREIMRERSSSSVVERIFALQFDHRVRFYNGIQHWNLRILPDGAVLFTCADTSGEVLYYEHGIPADLPSGDLSFVLQHNILHIKN